MSKKCEIQEKILFCTFLYYHSTKSIDFYKLLSYNIKQVLSCLLEAKLYIIEIFMGDE